MRLLSQTQAMVDQRKAPIGHLLWNDAHQLQRDLLPTWALTVCAATGADKPILQCYLHVKHNESHVKVTQFSEFRS